MATLHADVTEFLLYCEPDALYASARCPLCHRSTYVDLASGLMICYRHADVRRWTLRQLIDREARRLMEEAPRGARPYHRRGRA